MYVDCTCTIELEIRDTTVIARYILWIALHIDIEGEDRLRMKLYDKRDDFDFPIVYFPFIYSNNRAAPGLYIFQQCLLFPLVFAW
jgi:hypothetical protein